MKVIDNVLFAVEGKVVTNGADYGKIIYLVEGETPANYYEITEEEYIEILKVKEGEIDVLFE